MTINDDFLTLMLGFQGNHWMQGHIEIPPNSEPFQLVFEAIIGNNNQGIIAIDDVNVTHGSCSTNPGRYSKSV